MSDENLEHQAADQIIPGVTPAALLDAMENPDSFSEIARADLYVHMAHMRQAMRNPETPIGQRIEYGKFLAKMGKVDAPQHADNPLAGLPMIEIDLGDAGSVKIGTNAPVAPPPREEKDVTPVSDQDVDQKLPSKAVIP